MNKFDALLNSLADVLVRGQASGDSYGIAPNAFTTVASGIPCRVELWKGRPKEDLAGDKAGINYRVVYMRPWTDGGGNPLSTLNWLRIAGEYYDVMQVSLQDDRKSPHHLEVGCRLVVV